MPGRQTWSLSQDANKQRGTCSVCLEVRQLHGKDGKVHIHGPRDDRCQGSNKLPLNVLSSFNQHPSASSLSSTSDQYTASPILSSIPSTFVQVPSQSVVASKFGHPNLSKGTIKHIPKSARSASAAYFIDLLTKIQ